MRSDIITGTLLGLPAKFAQLRKEQVEAIEWAIETRNDEDSTSTLAARLATGSGKTAFGIGLAKLTGLKTIYLVSTKALQDQVGRDFSSCGVVDVRGRANYTCPNYGSCDRGADEECSLSKTLGCPYTVAVELAKASSMAVTNYSYWLTSRKHNPAALEYEGDPVELLICDEATQIFNELARAASVRIYANEIEHAWPFVDESGLPFEYPQWSAWADAETKSVRSRQLEIDDKKSSEYIELGDLIDRLWKIGRMSPNWTFQFNDRRTYVDFEPIRVSSYWPQLISNVPFVVLMSATLTPYALKLLIPSDTPFSYRAWPSVFPSQNAPVYHIPTRKLSWRSTDEDYQAVVRVMDEIIDGRLDRKGIVHTVSYSRAQTALRMSRHAGRMICNDSAADSTRAVKAFKAAGPGTVLVSPSVGTGWDFPGDDAEYQVILKFPFPNETSRVVRERCLQIPGYRLFAAAQELVQMAGRPIRSAADKAETMVLDNSVAQLKGPAGREFVPAGFRIWTVATVPVAPPRSKA